MIELVSFGDIIIQEEDKGNVIVLLDKSCYLDKMENILSDDSKFLPIVFEGEYDDLKFIMENKRK